MNAIQITEALSASFFALLGIWAAVDRRHWFVRFLVVSGLLLVTLFISAYEVVIEFGLQMALIMAGVWLARGRRGWRPRLSVETALLAMVVVAVAAAVIARIPDLHPGVWAFLINVGVSTAYAGLLALWFVCGRTRLWIHMFGGLVGLALFIVLFHFGNAVQHALWRTPASFNTAAMAEFYKRDEVLEWLARMLPTIALAAVILVSVLALARASGWFSTEGLNKKAVPISRRTVAARIGLATLLIAVAAPLAYLFYRLLTPPSRELLADLPTPNGFDDFVAAGEMTPSNVQSAFQSSQKLTRSVLEQHYFDLEPVAQRIALGLTKPCRVPLDDRNSWEGVNMRDAEAVLMAAMALSLRADYLARYGSTDELIWASLLLYQFAQEASRGSLGMLLHVGGYRDLALKRLEGRVRRLDADQSRALARKLWRLDAEREPFEVTERRQLISDQNGGWSRHLMILLDSWSGNEHFESHRNFDRKLSVSTRLLIANLAAHAYYLDRGRPPNSLAELVPKYMSGVPQDAFGQGTLRYRRNGLDYLIYSVGRDGIDARGESGLSKPSQGDDIVVRSRHEPPL